MRGCNSEVVWGADRATVSQNDFNLKSRFDYQWPQRFQSWKSFWTSGAETISKLKVVLIQGVNQGCAPYVIDRNRFKLKYRFQFQKWKRLEFLLNFFIGKDSCVLMTVAVRQAACRQAVSSYWNRGWGDGGAIYWQGRKLILLYT